MQRRGLSDGERGWTEPLTWQLMPPSPLDQGLRPAALVPVLPCQQVSFLASSEGKSGSTSHPPLDLPAEIPDREEQTSPSDAGFQDTNSSFSHILHLNTSWHEAVTDITPYHPCPMPHILSFSRRVSLGTSHPQPIPTGTEGQEAMGDGQAFKMLNGQKQAILSGGLNLS